MLLCPSTEIQAQLMDRAKVKMAEVCVSVMHWYSVNAHVNTIIYGFFRGLPVTLYFFSNLVLHSYYILVFRKRVHFESLPWAQVFPSTWRLMPVGQAQLEPLGGGARRHRWLQPPLFTAHGVRTTQKMTDGYGQMERD